MTIFNFVLLASALTFVTGCVSGAKRLAQLELAATNPAELEKICRDGLSGACALQGKPTISVTPLSVMQGVTSADSTRFAVVVPKNKKILYYAKSAGRTLKLEAERFTRAFSPLAVDQVQAFDLSLSENYELIMIDDQGMAIDRRSFRTLDLNKKNPRILLISCLDDSFKTEQAAMWKQVLSKSFDVVFTIGDNVYADRIPGGWALARPEQLWDRYTDTRQTLDFFKSPKLVPVLATWDDHDYGRNDSDRTYTFKDESKRVFQTFFPQIKATGNFEPGPGVASAWSAFGAQFMLLDGRYFRSPNRVSLPDETHFGAEQEEWISAKVLQAKTPVFLASGDQFFGGYNPFESYEGNHPRSFQIQTARWKKAKVPLMFLSGDRHLSEIIKIPRKILNQQTYELTSSPLHASVFPRALKDAPSPNQVVGFAGKFNFMIIELNQATAKRLRVNVQSFGLDKALHFEKDLTVTK